MTTLRKSLIHLAHANPGLRKHLMPLLKTAAAPEFQAGDVITWESPLGYEGNWEVASVKPWVHGLEYQIKKPKGRPTPLFFDRRDSVFMFENREIQPKKVA